MSLKKMDLYVDRTLKARMEIQVEEDQRIFDALDTLHLKCMSRDDPGYEGLISDCAHPECQVRAVIES